MGNSWGIYTGAGTRILDVEHNDTEPDQFDEVYAKLETRGGGSLRGGMAYALETKLGLGGGGQFSLTRSKLRYGEGGTVEQQATFTGAFSQKWRMETKSNIEVFSPSNIKILPVSSSVTWAKSQIMIAMPVVTLWVVDQVAPQLNLIGKQATAPYLGSFPLGPANPFTIPADTGTINYPPAGGAGGTGGGYVLTGIDGVENAQGGGVWRKVYSYVYRFDFTP